jgi:hypothetical protein
MFIRRKKVKNKYGHCYSYYYLVKQVRRDGKIKQDVVEYLGAMQYSEDIISRIFNELDKKYGVSGLEEKFWKVYVEHNKRRKHVRKKKNNKR